MEGRFKHQIYSNIVLSMLSGLQDPTGSCRIPRKGSMGHCRISIWSTHLNFSPNFSIVGY